MSATTRDFTTVLLARGILTAEQLAEAYEVVALTGARLQQALVKLGHVDEEQITQAQAEALGVPYVDLRGVTIAQPIIELMPESVARENLVLPFAESGRTLFVILADAEDHDTIQKLEFILNRVLVVMLSPREQILDAINRHYGQSETESVDSMLAEFTDTAIDFTETEATSEFEPDVLKPPTAAVQWTASPTRAAPRKVDRRATVRHYSRMNPERMFPLLVVLSKSEIEKVQRTGVTQAQSEKFKVAEGSLVEIEPVLPGCACYPPREQVRVSGGTVTTTFWVVPHVLGRVMGARVAVRQEGLALAEVPLEISVTRQSMTLVMGSLSLILPFVLLLLKHFKLDFESELENGFGLYAQLAGWLVQSLTPEWLTAGLLAGTVGLYLWLRPRRRDVFFDVTPVKNGGAAGGL